MLTILLVLPVLASLIILLLGSKKRFAGYFALVIAILECVFTGSLLISYNHTGLVYQEFVREIPVITRYFSMDGVSILLVLLTSLVIAFTLLISCIREKKYPPMFYALVLIMEFSLMGVFSTRHGLLFYIFWEMALIPMYFIAALWGGANRIRITFKFFIYTMLGSFFMLGALLYLYVKTPFPHQFGFDQLLSVPFNQKEQLGLILAFFIAFAIKIPIFPLHSWQPDTYAVASTEGSMLLAGIMLKMGLYGIIRFILPLTDHVILPVIQILILLSVISVLYGSLLALIQQEIKRLIAYASLAHVGLMAAALLSQRPDAMEGALYQMIAHGINILSLFFVADIIERRTSATEMKQLGGIAQTAPRFSIFFMVTMLGTVALPLTNGFVGEFLMLAGLAQYSMIVSAGAGLSIVFGAIYLFRFYRTSMYGEKQPLTESFTDMNTREMTVAVPLMLWILGTGIFSKPILLIAKSAVDHLLQ